MSDKESQIYEEWLGHPDRHEYVLLADHSKQANLYGWWASGWRFTHDEVVRIKHQQRAQAALSQAALSADA